MQSFVDLWNCTYGDLVPLAHRLRAVDVDGWVRFHTLPASTRYAENENDACEIHRRASAVGDAVLGAGMKCHLAILEADGERFADAYRAAIEQFRLEAALRFADPEDDEIVWTVHTAVVRWSADTFAPLLRKIADDELGGVLWLGRGGSVFAPYDGGIDTFTRPVEQAEVLKATFPEWLSPRPDGL